MLFCASDGFPFDKIATIIEGLKAKFAFAEPGEGAVEVPDGSVRGGSLSSSGSGRSRFRFRAAESRWPG